MDLFTHLSCSANGATVYFAQPDALRGSLGVTLKEVQPTFFMGVPRVWEKIHEKMAPMIAKMPTINDNIKRLSRSSRKPFVR